MNDGAMNIAFPLQIDQSGRTATATNDDHVQQMIEQLLFTRPGERVMQPTLGCSLLQLVFEPNSPEIAAVVQLTVQASLQQWLGDVIRVDSLTVSAADATVSVVVAYVILATGSAQQVTFTQGGPS
jgi:phage baseplate assembly protein W